MSAEAEGEYLAYCRGMIHAHRTGDRSQMRSWRGYFYAPGGGDVRERCERDAWYQAEVKKAIDDYHRNNVSRDCGLLQWEPK